MPFLVQVPRESETCEERKSYGYSVQKPSEEKPSGKRYVWNAMVQRPVEKKCRCAKQSYPVTVEVIKAAQHTVPKYIYNAQVHVPHQSQEKTCSKSYATRLDTIILPRPDCPQPKCKKPCHDDELKPVPSHASSDSSSDESYYETESSQSHKKGKRVVSRRKNHSEEEEERIVYDEREDNSSEEEEYSTEDIGVLYGSGESSEEVVRRKCDKKPPTKKCHKPEPPVKPCHHHKRYFQPPVNEFFTSLYRHPFVHRIRQFFTPRNHIATCDSLSNNGFNIDLSFPILNRHVYVDDSNFRRDKRSFPCATVRKLQNNPRYRKQQLDYAGITQYLPEISPDAKRIDDEPEKEYDNIAVSAPVAGKFENPRKNQPIVEKAPSVRENLDENDEESFTRHEKRHREKSGKKRQRTNNNKISSKRTKKPLNDDDCY